MLAPHLSKNPSTTPQLADRHRSTDRRQFRRFTSARYVYVRRRTCAASNLQHHRILPYFGRTCWTAEVEPADDGALRMEEPGLGRTTNATSAAGAHRATIVRKGGAISVCRSRCSSIKNGQATGGVGLTPAGGLRLAIQEAARSAPPFESDLLLHYCTCTARRR